MNMLMRTISAAVAAVCLGSIAVAAPTPVGKWNGNIDASGIKLPTPKTDAEKQQMKTGLAMLTKIKILLVFKADKTYTATMTNPNGQTSNNNGTWTQEGMTIKTKGKNGNSTSMTLSADGRRMTATPPAGPGAPAGLKIILTKI